NSKLQDFISTKISPQQASEYKQQISAMKSGETSSKEKDGMVLKKEEIKGEKPQKTSLNGIIITFAVVIATIILCIFIIKKRRKNNN
ncbi:MAG: hypothetical protein LBQ84_05590, partial [Flavobacteriaceae bacterium]|nr:hypothetical protein [Flavobacteriaceae bacterium]